MDGKKGLVPHIAAYEKYLRFFYITVMVISGTLNEIEMLMKNVLLFSTSVFA